MPFALRKAESGQLLACPQVNGYQLPYYGIVLWQAKPDAAEISEALARAEAACGAAWEAVELTEHQAKMANVKLRNDAGRRVYLRDGTLQAE